MMLANMLLLLLLLLLRSHRGNQVRVVVQTKIGICKISNYK